jgi:hypothetical protein
MAYRTSKPLHPTEFGGPEKKKKTKKATTSTKLTSRDKHFSDMGWSIVEKPNIVAGSRIIKPKPKPKPFIKYKKGGKVIGTSKYRQGEGQLGVKERFKRDKK